MKKVGLAMSGGVDSTFSALQLIEAGYEVIGITMDLGEAGVVEKARDMAARIGIRHYVLDAREEFKTEVRDYFLNEYKLARTPNPCVVCNRKIKFGSLFDYALALGCDYFATGHYCQVVEINGRYTLRKAQFLQKDQSYVLFYLSQDVLSRLILPLSTFTKDEARAKMIEFGLGELISKDSQDICFIPDGDYRAYLGKNGLVDKLGNFVDTSGKILGAHLGISNYTIGQRKGLGIALGYPAYVVSINAETGDVVIGVEEDLNSWEFWVSDCNFMAIEKLVEPMEAFVKIRYKSPAVKANLLPITGGVKVVFTEAQKSITPGQACVFYLAEDENVVLGGGIIEIY